MHRREMRHTQSTQQREMQPVDVSMYDVEILCPLRNRFKQESGGSHQVESAAAQGAAREATPREACRVSANRRSRKRVTA